MPSANPRQLSVHQLENFFNFYDYSLGFQDFLIYLVRYFWSLLNFPNLIFHVNIVNIVIFS